MNSQNKKEVRNGKAKKKGSRAKRIFLGSVGIIVLLIVLLVWGKNLGEQVSHTPFAVSNDAEATEHGASVVYMTTDISPEGMLAIYEALGVEANGNVAVNLSIDCDCESDPAEPDMHDIGILASTDPVALDQACVDLVYAAEDGASLIERIESRNGLLTLKHAEEIGLGTRWYQLTNID